MSDLSFLAHTIGQCGSFSTSFRCLFCETPSNKFCLRKTANLRTTERIKLQATEYRRLFDVEKITDTKRLYGDTKCIKDFPLFEIPFDRIVPSPMHILQGIGNKLIAMLKSSLTEDGLKNLHRFYSTVGASIEAFRKRDFTGNAIYRILQKIGDLSNFIDTTDEIDTLMEFLWNLKQILSKTSSRFLNPDEIFQLELSIFNFGHLIDEKKPELHTMPKTHILLKHVIPFVKLHGFLGLMNEQAIEATHSMFNSDMQDMKFLPEKQQVLHSLKRNFIRNVSFDTGRWKDN